MTLPVQRIGNEISIGDGYVSIEKLVIQNAELASFLNEIPESERLEMFLKIVGFGTETFKLFNTSATAEALKNVSLSVTNDISQKREEIIRGVEDIAKKLTSDEDNLSISRVLSNWRIDFQDLLKKNFDETNTESILSKFDSLLKKSGESQNGEILSRLDFNSEGSVVNMLQNNLKNHIGVELAKILSEISKVNSALDKAAGAKEAKKLQAGRGKEFETVVFEMVEELSRLKGDLADNPGPRNQPGLDGNNEGDIVVSIDVSETGGTEKNFVFECKLRKNKTSEKKLLEELDKGISNRGSLAGVIIAETIENEIDGKFDFFREFSGNRAILYLDSENPDINSLRFAYLWSRSQVLNNEGITLNTEVLKGSLKSIRMAINSFVQLKTNNTKAIGHIETNVELIEKLENAINAELSDLDGLIKVVEDEQRSS